MVSRIDSILKERSHCAASGKQLFFQSQSKHRPEESKKRSRSGIDS